MDHQRILSLPQITPPTRVWGHSTYVRSCQLRLRKQIKFPIFPTHVICPARHTILSTLHHSATLTLHHSQIRTLCSQISSRITSIYIDSGILVYDTVSGALNPEYLKVTSKWAFVMSGTSYPVTQRHMPHDRNPRLCHCGNIKINNTSMWVWNQCHYRPEVPRGFQEVKVPRLRDNGPGWWQSCQPYAPAVSYPQEILLVLISITGWVDPRAIVRLKGIYVNEKSTDTSWDRNSDLPICSTAPHRATAVICECFPSNCRIQTQNQLRWHVCSYEYILEGRRKLKSHRTEQKQTFLEFNLKVKVKVTLEQATKA